VYLVPKLMVVFIDLLNRRIPIWQERNYRPPRFENIACRLPEKPRTGQMLDDVG
jgi:hypothetical protein